MRYRSMILFLLALHLGGCRRAVGNPPGAAPSEARVEELRANGSEALFDL